ncbi:hypothetical protein ES708_23823 [subsurface metagenome]
MAEITARDVKASLEALDKKLEEAQQYTRGYDLAPKYVSRNTHYIYVKLFGLRCTLDNLRARVPEYFQSERRG